MESQPNLIVPSSSSSSSPAFQVGDTVIYHRQGRYTIMAIESRSVGDNSLSFYRLEMVKSSFSRSSRKEPAIWLPVATATQRGLRHPITAEQAPEIWAILESRETYFPQELHWSQVLATLDQCLQTEGAIGIAKVVSYVHARTKRHVLAPSDLAKYWESVSRLLIRELSDIAAELPRDTEEKMIKAMRHKAMDH